MICKPQKSKPYPVFNTNSVTLQTDNQRHVTRSSCTGKRTGNNLFTPLFISSIISTQHQQQQQRRETGTTLASIERRRRRWFQSVQETAAWARHTVNGVKREVPGDDVTRGHSVRCSLLLLLLLLLPLPKDTLIRSRDMLYSGRLEKWTMILMVVLDIKCLYFIHTLQ